MTKLEKDCKNFGFICDVGGKLKGNQDSALICEFNLIIAPGSPKSKSFSHKGYLALIADGVSGSNHGEEGSTFAIRHFASKFYNFIFTQDFEISTLSQKIGEILRKTNEALLNKYEIYVQKGKVPKTTFVGIVVIGQWLWVFNLGDSKAFVLKDGLISQISKDHVGSTTLHEITQAFGQETIEPHIKVYNWAFESKNDIENPSFNSSYYCVLCSDGLSDKVSMEEINEKFIQKGNSINIQENVENLYNLSMEREIDDNISIIAIDLAAYFNNIDKIELYQLLQE
jgi:protein phosphatase